MHAVAQQLRLAFRRLLRDPLFTLTAGLTLALGIGANTAIFSVVNAVLLKPLPYEDAEDLVGVWHLAPGLGMDASRRANMSPALYLVYREGARSLEGIGLWDDRQSAVSGLDRPEQVEAHAVTHGLFGLLRARPAIGRLFTEVDDSPGSPETIVLSYGYWQRRFGGDPAVVGRQLVVDGRGREIIGVLPRDFRFVQGNPEIIYPVRIDPSQVIFGGFYYQGVARPKPGVTAAQMNADLAPLILVAADRFPDGVSRAMIKEVGFTPDIRPLKEEVVGDVQPVLWVIFGTVGLVLLMACANVANLFLVRAEGRSREVAVRSAMGADRWRIARDFLIESAVLSGFAAVAGVVLASVGLRLLLRLAPDTLPRLGEVSIDGTALLFTLGVTVLAAILFGVFPIVRYQGLHLVNALKEGSRGSSSGPGRNRTRNALVASQLALAFVLLVGSGLMVRSFQALRHVHPGFERPEEILTFRVTIPIGEVPDDEAAAQLHEQILRRVEQLPAVSSAGMSASITMDGWDNNDAVFVEDFPVAPNQIPPIRRVKRVAGDYFGTMENPVLAGRAMGWADIQTRAPVAMITENMAKEYWGSAAEAIGRRIGRGPLPIRWREIVGVVGDVRDDGVGRPATAVVYMPQVGRSRDGVGISAERSMAFAVRSSGPPPTALLPAVREAVWSVTPTLPLANVRTLDEILARSVAPTSFTMAILGIAAMMALLLGSVGVYGVLSYIVSQRTREIGVRMAIGAQSGHVRGMVLRYGLGVLAVGGGIGLVASLLLTRLMSALLFGVSPFDPLTYAVVTGALGVVALAASYLPARRATGIDPAEALRAE